MEIERVQNGERVILETTCAKEEGMREMWGRVRNIKEQKQKNKCF